MQLQLRPLIPLRICNGRWGGIGSCIATLYKTFSAVAKYKISATLIVAVFAIANIMVVTSVLQREGVVPSVL